MAFKLFKKHCSICGQDIEKGKEIKRFGKYLCSEEHAEEYSNKIAKKESKAAGGGGCCG